MSVACQAEICGRFLCGSDTSNIQMQKTGAQAGLNAQIPARF
jgi:hypothetical protein